MSKLRVDQHGNYDLDQIAEVVKRCGEKAPERLQVVRWLYSGLMEAAPVILEFENEIRHHQMLAAAVLRTDYPPLDSLSRFVPSGAIGQAVRLERQAKREEQMARVDRLAQVARVRKERGEQTASASAEPVL